ncbi:MAG: hypothetical protein KDJ90_01740 [Nitratireductor sp.]|nr:hypothetical protein [Nitratireductor sp.]
MIVGEQAGDIKDLAGRPFVGPAETLLRDLMNEAGIVRSNTSSLCRTGRSEFIKVRIRRD